MSAIKKHRSIFHHEQKEPPLGPQISSGQDVVGEVVGCGIQNPGELMQSNIIEIRRGPKRRWFFSRGLADRVCELIVQGNSLESISRRVGFPSLWVIRQWRLQHPQFNDMIRAAREDRAEFYLSKMIELATDCGSRDQEPLARLKFSFYKWASQIRDPGTFGIPMHK